MDTQNQSTVVESTVAVTATPNTLNDSDRNADRQNFMRGFLHTVRNGVGVEKLYDDSFFTPKDLKYFRGLYGGYTYRKNGQIIEVPGFLTKRSSAFPIGVAGEVEKLQNDRKILKERHDDLNEKDLRRYLYVLSHMQKLQAVVKELDLAILRRQANEQEMLLQKPVIQQGVVQGVTQQGPVQQGVKQGALWIRDRDVTKAEALEIAQLTEEKLANMLRDSEIHSTKVICIYSDKERLSYEKIGAVVRYIIEKRA
jgi:hypothetical protein